MPTSLMKLCESGGNLRLLSDAEIHYPPEGASNLSEVESGHFWFTERRKLILSLLHKFGQFETLSRMGADIGCGSGYTAAWLTGLGFPTIGIDVHPGFSEIQRKGLAAGFVHGDVFSVEPMEEFDFILLLDTLEHISDDRQFVNHVGKMLKPGGVVVLTVPAFSWLWSPVDDRAGHFRRYTKSDLKKFESLPDTHLKNIYSTYFYGSTLPLFFLSRKLGAKKHSKPRDDLERPLGEFINSLLKMLLRAEACIACSIGVPIGSSLFTVFRKETSQ